MNIFDAKFLKEEERCLCAPFFFACSMKSDRSGKSTKYNRARVCKLLLLLCAFSKFMIICIRQHDVNILMRSCLREVRDVCVLRFFSLYVSQKVIVQKGNDNIV